MFDYKKSNSAYHFGLYEDGDLIGIVEFDHERVENPEQTMKELVGVHIASAVRQEEFFGAQDDLPCPYCLTQGETNYLEVDMEHHYSHYGEADIEQMDATCIVYYCTDCMRAYQFALNGELTEI